MYVTRRLSMYQKDPSLLSLPPPDGLDTSILVIQDVKKKVEMCCFGSIRCVTHYYIPDLPFPQNTALYYQKNCLNDYCCNFLAIPVINKPLSTGLYYIISFQNNCLGLAYTANGAKGEYKSCFCFKHVKEAGLRPLDLSNIYQQFYIRRCNRGFQFKSFASDGHVPKIFRDEYWTVYCILHRVSSLDHSLQECLPEFKLDDDASGLDHSLRERLPEFNFPLSQETTDAVVVGKWYCPFIFVKEEKFSLKNQMQISMFYEMKLKQQWVKIFACINNKDTIIGDSVAVDINVETEVVDVVGMKNCENTKLIHGVKWFQGFDKEGGAALSVGLNRVIIDKIIRDQESFGWVGGQAKVKRLEKFEGKDSEWKKFGCYVLVEKYILRRGDKKLVLTYEFWHTQHIRCKWE